MVCCCCSCQHSPTSNKSDFWLPLSRRYREPPFFPSAHLLMLTRAHFQRKIKFNDPVHRRQPKKKGVCQSTSSCCFRAPRKEDSKPFQREEKKQITNQRLGIRALSHYPTITLESRRQWNKTVKNLRANGFKLGIPYPTKRNQVQLVNQAKTFSDTSKTLLAKYTFSGNTEECEKREDIKEKGKKWEPGSVRLSTGESKGAHPTRVKASPSTAVLYSS